jgi:hypothetical protein
MAALERSRGVESPGGAVFALYPTILCSISIHSNCGYIAFLLAFNVRPSGFVELNCVTVFASHIMFRSTLAIIIGLLVSGVSYAATFSFDGFIERETENSNDDHHTLDFFRIQIPSASMLTIVGTEGTLPDLSIRLYLQGERGSLELSGLPTTRVSDTVLQIQGVPAAGNYVLAVLPASATDWDRFEGLQSNFGVSGQDPPLGLGSYHIDITGDFTVTEILEGHLDIPEPSALWLGLLGGAVGCLALLASHARRAKNVAPQDSRTMNVTLCESSPAPL